MKSVTLVGLHKPTLKGVETTRTDETWTLNTAMSSNNLNLKNVTRLFEMHPVGLIQHALYDPKPGKTYWEWLTETEHPYQVVMLEALPEVHNAITYPFEIIQSDYLMHDDDPVAYSTSTFSYMLALAIHEGYDYIEVYGFSLPTKTEYVYQRGAAEHWMGVAEGKGIRVWMHKDISILKGSLYGYEAAQVVSRQTLEAYNGFYSERRDKCVAEINHAAGRLSKTTIPEEQELLRAVIGQHQSVFHQYAGAQRFIELMIDFCDGAQINPEEMEPIGKWGK